LYQAGVDEQLIMEVSGHLSTRGVRQYKHTSPEQKRKISEILSIEDEEKEDDVKVPPPPFPSRSQITFCFLEKALFVCA